MTFSPRLRKAALVLHVTTSVGWCGAVAAFLVLAVTANVSSDPSDVRAAYLAMEIMGWTILVPLSVLAFASGILQSVGTKWGLIRYYWVLFKLGITVVATAVLLSYTQTLEALGSVAAAAPADVNPADLRNPSPVLHSAVGIALLLIATGLAIFKPPGMTRYGRRAARRARAGRLEAGSTR